MTEFITLERFERGRWTAFLRTSWTARHWPWLPFEKRSRKSSIQGTAVDKRRKPLSTTEQLLVRQAMASMVAQHPDWEVPKMLKAIRRSLHLTTHEMARVGGISELALRNLEAGRSSPTLKTVESLLRPFGLKLAVIQTPRPDHRPTEQSTSRS